MDVRESIGRDARERLLAGIPARQRTLLLAGISTAVLEGGDGPPIVLLHSSGEFAALWLRVMPSLATTHRVIAPDLARIAIPTTLIWGRHDLQTPRRIAEAASDRHRWPLHGEAAS
jgi:pimeloyl-ACP methyl ester carboxylesterase